jgi:6-phosphogluconolactonase
MSTTRRRFLLALAAAPAARPQASSDNFLVYVGTYTAPRTKSTGIHAYRFNASTGDLAALGVAAETPNPSFLAVHPSCRFLYAANEISDYEGQRAGSVSAFSIDAASGRLTLLNRVSTRGAGACHLNTDRTGRALLVANYGGGSVAAFPIAADGRLGEASSLIQHTGSSVNPQRQQGPHAHSVNISSDNRFAVVADLGLDKLLLYRLDPAKATLTPNEPAFVSVAPGSGPRHFAFHPTGRFAYVINEILCTVTAFSYDAKAGALKEIQTLSTLPAGFTRDDTISTAEVQVHPSGRFLYGSNRGHNSIAVFSIDLTKGTLALLENVPTQGRIPRNFAIDPTGAWLFAENQQSDSIVLFRVDAKTGRLTPAGRTVEVPSPVCVRFAALR